MGLFAWLLGFGLPGAIAKDLIRKYEKVKITVPDASEVEVLNGVWGIWLALNMQHIVEGKDTDKKVRLEIMMEEIEKDKDKRYHKNLLEYFDVILYIETGIICAGDEKIYMKCLRIFVQECKKRGINFEDELTRQECFLKKLNKL